MILFKPLKERILRVFRKPIDHKRLLFKFSELSKIARKELTPPICKQVNVETGQQLFDLSKILRQEGYVKEADDAKSLAIRIAYGLHVNLDKRPIYIHQTDDDILNIGLYRGRYFKTITRKDFE